jgi:hypothetical protein
MCYQTIGLNYKLWKIYSKIEEGKLLHIINRLDEINGRTEMVPEDNFIQCVTLKNGKGKLFHLINTLLKNELTQHK